MAKPLGLISVKSNSDLDAEALELERATHSTEPPHHITELAAYIKKCFEDAEQHRNSTGVTARILDCQRRRKGEYDAATSAEVEKRGGCKQFFNITDTKCSAGEAWTHEVNQVGGNDLPWGLEPTPLPDLPEDAKLAIHQRVMQEFMALQAQGQTVTREALRMRAGELYDEEQQAVKEDGDECAARMQSKIADQMVEGGWYRSFKDFVQYLWTYPSAVFKGPVVKAHKRRQWQNGQPVIVDEVIPTWEAVNPHDFYPAANIRTVQEGYICEVVRFDKADLANQKAQEGWNADEIAAVLSDEAVSKLPVTPEGDSDRAAMENRSTTENAGVAATQIQGVEFWGTVEGKLLAEWGMTVEDESAFYHVMAILIGEHVVKATLNPDKLGKVPYFVTSYEKVAGSVWGKGLPEKMSDCQDGYNACKRNMMNNLALASWGQFFIDRRALDQATDPTKIYPGKLWFFDSAKSHGGRPMEYVSIPNNAEELDRIAEGFKNEADDRTLIPRFVHGQANVGGAGETASGLSMLMNAAAKGVKAVLLNIDEDVTRPAIEHLYGWDLDYLEDESLKGDIRVVARGVMGALVREQNDKRRMEYLTLVLGSPMAQQILQVKGVAELLRAGAQRLDMPVDKIVPSEDEIDRMMAAMQPSVPETEQAPSGATEQGGVNGGGEANAPANAA
jgi:hypothetical protein